MSVTTAQTSSAESIPEFGTLRQIDAGLLNVGYVDAGPPHGPAVVLLHGWPYDIHSYAEVMPLLTAAGYRVIVPHLRGTALRGSARAEPFATDSNRHSPST
jgi:pimeloyl-ACP methyl ester carboxylesterase